MNLRYPYQDIFRMLLLINRAIMPCNFPCLKNQSNTMVKL